LEWVRIHKRSLISLLNVQLMFDNDSSMHFITERFHIATNELQFFQSCSMGLHPY
jgi:hypothetical protein